jgi:hypothetical protein
MPSLPVVEDLGVFEAGSLHAGVSGITNPMCRLIFEAVEQLSGGALSEQSSFRPIEQVVPYFFSSVRNAWLPSGSPGRSGATTLVLVSWVRVSVTMSDVHT